MIDVLIYRQSTDLFSDYDIFELEMEEGIMVLVVVMISCSMLVYACICYITDGNYFWPGWRQKLREEGILK